MIVACWILAATVSLAYALLLELSTPAARTAAPVFTAVALAVWIVLTIHHNRRGRR